jgi:hypothetical protein
MERATKGEGATEKGRSHGRGKKEIMTKMISSCSYGPAVLSLTDGDHDFPLQYLGSGIVVGESDARSNARVRVRVTLYTTLHCTRNNDRYLCKRSLA